LTIFSTLNSPLKRKFLQLIGVLTLFFGLCPFVRAEEHEVNKVKISSFVLDSLHKKAVLACQREEYSEMARLAMEGLRLSVKERKLPIRLKLYLVLAEAQRALSLQRQSTSTLRQTLRDFSKSQNMSWVYNRLAAAHYELSEYSTATHYLNCSLATLPEGGDTLPHTGMTYALIGAIAVEQNEPEKGLLSLKKAYTLIADADSTELDMVLHKIGRAYAALGQFNGAVVALQEGLHHATKVRNTSHEIILRAELADVFYWKQEYRNAARELRRLERLRNIYNEGEEKKLLSDTQARFNTRQRNIELARVTAEAKASLAKIRLLQFTIGAGGVLLLLMLGTLMLFIRLRNKSIKQQRRLQRQKTRITEQKAELERLNLTKDTLISVISHDVRGPVSSLRAGMELAIQGYLSEQDIQKILRGLAQSSLMTEQLLNDILVWAKSQMQGLKAECEPLFLRATAGSVMEQIAPEADAAFVKLSLEGEPLVALADDGMLRVVLRNLLSNALKNTPAGGQIRLYCELDPSGTKAQLRIEDTGKGIKQDRLAELLDVHAAVANMRKGTSNGLGLILARDFMEAQSGGLTLRSDPGQGTHATIWLPLATVQADKGLPLTMATR
jgi:two-component system, sensor histidine kinase and response regulator